MNRQHPQHLRRPSGAAAQAPPGLFRAQFAVPGRPLEEVFAAVEARSPAALYCHDQLRRVRGARYAIDRSQGEGRWDLFSVGHDLYVAATDAVYDQPRLETFAGEGNFEFYVKLSGRLRIDLPRGRHLDAYGPSCTVLRVEEGVSLSERLESQSREVCVSIHCRPALVRELLASTRPQIAATAWDALNAMHGPVAYRQLSLTPGMAACVRGVIDWPHAGRLGLLYKEAKALELVCLVIDALCGGRGTADGGQSTDPRIDRARSILYDSIAEIPNIAAIARAVGVCESKLTRDFKARFGKTMLEFNLDRRMGLALDLLRVGDLPIREVALAVGYRHHTSFSAAFQRYFGFPPKRAAMHSTDGGGPRSKVPPQN